VYPDSPLYLVLPIKEAGYFYGGRVAEFEEAVGEVKGRLGDGSEPIRPFGGAGVDFKVCGE
jgi:hypothetical protein